MLYKQEAIPVVAEGFAETTHFDIPASGKAFKSLIDNIYSRKIEAPIRELCTNAFDAHLEADLDEPFRLKLPTKFDPMFMVRDYGLGMTHEFIMGDFKSLFKSTKDHTNKVVGMKGLGSKSPFAYTDAFILRVFSGKSVRTYSTYIGENGIPQLAYQGESPSDERRGVAVQFPVQIKDIDDFYASAIRVLKGFPVLPEGLPRTVTDALSGSACTPLEAGKTWKAYPKDYLGEGAFAKQGCVIYPVDLDKLKDGGWLKTLSMSLVIDLPIGSVQMVDSREFLAYDEETIANINAAVNAIHKEIDDRIKTIMKTAKTQWEIRALFRNDMFSNLGPLARSSTFYSRITALNSYLNEGLPRNRERRQRGEGVFYSAVVRYSGYSHVNQSYATAYTRNDDAYSDSDMQDPIFVFIGKDKKARRNMNARAQIYLEQNPKTTAVVMLEKLPLHVFRKLGKPKIMRTSDLPPMPIKDKVARDPVDWERFKELTSGYAMQEIDDDDPKASDLTTYFMFVNKGCVFMPGEDRQYSTRDLYSEDQMLRFFKNTRIVFINVRLNEKMDRWPEAEFPRYKPGMLDGVFPSLPKSKVIPIINRINNERFERSVYDTALDKLGRERVREKMARGQTNPLFDLIRFEDRNERLTKEQTKLFSSLTEDMKEEIIDRALALGLEVLPDCDCRMADGQGPWIFPYPLLKGKWERLAQCLGDYNDNRKYSLIIDLIVKEF